MTVNQALALALVIGAVLGLAARLLLKNRTHLGLAASVLSGIAGAFLGTALMTVLRRGSPDIHLALGVIAAFVGTVVVILIATALTRTPDPTPEELIAGGESSTVEFKSSARYNRHSRQRDERIELVIAKTVAGLLNADGGHLLIGVDDEGQVVGLADDFTLMKQPDSDRFELWLRDYLTRTIGAAATTSLSVSFPVLSGQEVCHVRIPPGTRPVYLIPAKGEGPQLWVRVGNSTRQLPLDQAMAYASDRWGRRGIRASRL